RIEKAKDSQIIIITHRMYLSICRGNHPKLIEDRDILIIDEYPDLLEKVSVFQRDIGYLWTINYKYKSDTIQKLAYRFRKILEDGFHRPESLKGNKIQFIDFKEKEIDTLRVQLSDTIRLTNNLNDKELLMKFQQLLENGCFFYEKGFHTIDNKF